MLTFPSNFVTPQPIRQRPISSFPNTSPSQARSKQDSVHFGLTHATQLVKLAPNTPLHQIHWYDVAEGLKVGTSTIKGRDYFVMLPSVNTTEKTLAKLLSHTLIQHSERPYSLILAAPEQQGTHEFVNHIRDNKNFKISAYGGNKKAAVPDALQALYHELKPSSQATLYVLNNRRLMTNTFIEKIVRELEVKVASFLTSKTPQTVSNSHAGCSHHHH